MKTLHLPGVEQNPKPGIYKDLIAKTQSQHPEYPKIWDLFAFGQGFTPFLARFTNGLLREPASISPGLRELVAAYTSWLNQCAFCTKAHAATAAVLLGSEELVAQALSDPETAPLDAREKALLRFVEKVTLRLPDVTAEDSATLREAGWDDEAIYFTITTCALFNFYNRWITASGVPPMSDDMHRWQGKLLATGYVRD